MRSIAVRLAIALVAGVIIGVLDLWIYQLSVRGFLAGLAAGIVYTLLIVFLCGPPMARFPWFLFGFAIVAGAIAGTAWWLVCHGSRLWVAIAVGSVSALAHFAGQGLFARRR